MKAASVAARAEKRPGGTAATQLHADAKKKCAGDDRYTGGGDRTANGLSEHASLRHEGNEHYSGDRQHQHLRAQAAAAPVHDQLTPG